MKETGGNYRLFQVTDKLDHIMLYWVHAWQVLQANIPLSLIGADQMLKQYIWEIYVSFDHDRKMVKQYNTLDVFPNKNIMLW